MISKPTINGFNPFVKSPKFNNVRMNTKVAIVSLKKLYKPLLIAGPVAKIPTTLPSLASFAFLNCAPYWMMTKTAPTKAPKN